MVTICGACSHGSGGSAAPSTTVPTAHPTVTPSTVSPPSTTQPVTPALPVVDVPPSVDATGRNNVTASLQRFLGSVANGHEIRFAKNGHYRIEGTLFLKNRRQLTLDGNGATLFATTRGGPDRAQWWIKDGSHIVFRDMIVQGANTNGGVGKGAYVAKLETQHGFRLEGVNGAELDHVQVHNVYGDFVYIGRDRNHVPSHDIWIHDCTFTRNGRQGVSVTAATDVIIEHNSFNNTRRATIDLEPNSRSWHVSDVFVLNNLVGKGRLLFVASHGQGPVNSIVISGNKLLGHPLTIDVKPPGTQRRSNWVVVNNTSNTSVRSRPMRFFSVDGLIVRGNRQQVTGGDPGVVLDHVCGAQVSGNQFGSGGVRRTASQCSAPLVVPAVPAIPGRGTPGTVPTVSTTAPSTTVPASTTPTSRKPAPGSGSGGGFDLFDWVLVAMGACVLLAIVLAFRSRRTEADGPPNADDA